MAADYHNDAGLQALFFRYLFSSQGPLWQAGSGRTADSGGRAVEGEKEKLLDQAGQIEKYLKSQERTGRQAEPELGAVHQAFRQLADCFDSKNGGFGSAPKFPAPTI